MNRKLSVLAIAEAANPEWTSVPLVGWSLSKNLRSVANVHIVTQIRNKNAIIRSGLKENIDFTAIDSEILMRPLWLLSSLVRGGEGKGWTTAIVFSTIGYYYFEHLVWKTFKSKLLKRKFDLVHRITPLSPTTPSLLAKKCKQNRIPFILGPLNGGVPWPKDFDNARRKEREWLSYIRGAYRFMPGYKSTLRSSSAIITGSKDTLKQVPLEYHKKCIYLPENAIEPENFSKYKYNDSNKVLQACFVGRLVPYKGPDMLIEAAMPLLKQKKMKLDIIGDGPMMHELKKTIIDEQISDAVILHGWIHHSKLQNLMSKSNILTFPSIREFGGGVVLEAMAIGLIPVVVDYGGPGELVDYKVGFKVPIGSRSQIVQRFRSVLYDITNNPNLNELSRQSIQRVDSFFTWNAKAKQILEIYNWVLKKRNSKPDFFDF